VFLDTQGESRIGVIAFSVVFDDSRFVYRRDLSDAEDQILYSPFGGKGSNQPARWMEPLPDPPELWPPANPVRVTPGFITGLGYTFATATNVRMATLTFEAIAPGSSLFDVSLDYDSDGFGIEDPNDGTVLYITDQVSVLGDFVATVGGAEAVPGLAVGLGGLALGSMLLAIGARAIAGKPRD